MPAAYPGIRGQTQTEDYLDFSGTITTGGTAQLVVPQQLRRLSLYFQNLATTNAMYLGISPPRPVATISGGQVTAIANPGATAGGAGIGFTVVPQVVISGGIYPGDYQTSPAHPAVAHATGLTSGGITGYVIDDPGVGYVVAPLISLVNPAPQLGGGAFLPGSGIGIMVAAAGGFFSLSGALLVPAGAVWVFDTGTDNFTCKVGIA